MKRLIAVTVLSTLLILIPSTVYADPTGNVLGGGICINEILADPTGTVDFDTDGDGTAVALDEFVELYNLSGSDIDISGWQLWDSGMGLWFTFPGSADDGTTVLAAGAYTLVVLGVQTGGSLPVMTNPNSLAFDAERGTAVINDGGDNVVLYDPGADQYIQLLFNADTADDPHTYTNFPATATIVGSVEDWGSDTDGYSLTRYPSGDTVVGRHDTVTPGGAQASPTRVTLAGLAGSSTPFASLATAFVLAIGLVVLRKHK